MSQDFWQVLYVLIYECLEHSLSFDEEKFNFSLMYRDGMVKMSETCEQFGGDINTINAQLDANAKSIDRVNSLLHQYQV